MSRYEARQTASGWTVRRHTANGHEQWVCTAKNETMAKRIAKLLTAFEPDKALANKAIAPL